MASIKEHWFGLRYHMISGAFWYCAGFVNWVMVTNTFKYLSQHIGATLTVLGDIIAILIIFLCILHLLKLWNLGGVSPTLSEVKKDQTSVAYPKVIDNVADRRDKYLVVGDSYFHIPNEPTFEALGKIFGFWWQDSVPMSSEDIKQTFTGGQGKQLPDISKFYEPK